MICALVTIREQVYFLTDQNEATYKSLGYCVQKRKVEGRAAKLVKMVHSARATRQDTEGALRKVKFRISITDVVDIVAKSGAVTGFICFLGCFLLDFLLAFLSNFSVSKFWKCLYFKVNNFRKPVSDNVVD